MAIVAVREYFFAASGRGSPFHLLELLCRDYMRLYLLLLPALVLIGGCASNPNSRWLEGAMMSFEVLEVGPKQYKLFANGAGAHKREEVERGFLVRAREICSDQEFSHEFQTTPYQYGSSGGGFSFTHNAFKTVGIIKCK